MTGIFYLHPNSPTWRTKPPACWCHATAAYACMDGTRPKAEFLCAAHMPAWAQARAMTLPAPPPGEAA